MNKGVQASTRGNSSPPGETTTITDEQLAQRLEKLTFAGSPPKLGSSPPKLLRSSLDSPRGVLTKSNLTASSETTQTLGCMEVIEDYDNAIFLFADMKGFSELSKTLSSRDIVAILNPIYSSFDSIIQKYSSELGDYTVKHEADCIMVGASSKDKDRQAQQAKAMVSIGLEMTQYLMHTNGDKARFRIGLNMGEASLVQIKSQGTLHKDWIGEGVNLASRMESSGHANQVQVTESLHRLVENDFTWSERTHCVKSYEKLTTYFAICPKPVESPKGYYPSNPNPDSTTPRPPTRKASLSTPIISISTEDLLKHASKSVPK